MECRYCSSIKQTSRSLQQHELRCPRNPNVIPLKLAVSSIDNDQIEVAVGHNVQRFPHSDEEAMGIHHDKSTPYTTHGVVLYFNDNYEGGELFYNKLNKNLKPESCSLILHRADISHGVKEVTKGIRYYATAFLLEI